MLCLLSKQSNIYCNSNYVDSLYKMCSRCNPALFWALNSHGLCEFVLLNNERVQKAHQIISSKALQYIHVLCTRQQFKVSRTIKSCWNKTWNTLQIHLVIVKIVNIWWFIMLFVIYIYIYQSAGNWRDMRKSFCKLYCSINKSYKSSEYTCVITTMKKTCV